ncbi:hypothetical protein AAFF_G00192940 [Aldrovandia affinis]|uniref:Uncharacterized protein n=1 Tax=Aldrovandia affinis TaxID=143900 RepID=A0AAD7RIQ5_9TELE|nr:hypothetical protein AAFF_G00192940 [Aldrovandia affinis]
MIHFLRDRTCPPTSGDTLRASHWFMAAHPPPPLGRTVQCRPQSGLPAKAGLAQSGFEPQPQ